MKLAWNVYVPVNMLLGKKQEPLRYDRDHDDRSDEQREHSRAAADEEPDEGSVNVHAQSGSSTTMRVW